MLNSKKKFVPNISDINSDDSFATLLNDTSFKEVKAGSVVKGKIIGVEKDVVVIDIGAKHEGRIPLSEFSLALELPTPVIGDFIDVYIDKTEGKNGKIVLSREKAIREEAWNFIGDAFAQNKKVKGVIFGRVKGGFIVDLSGAVAFLPGSQVDVRPVKDTDSLMNLILDFYIIKMDKANGNIIVSRRAILEEARGEAKNKLLAEMTEGMTVKGVVKNITDYGAFIEVDNIIDGLLHITDISWHRVNHPSEKLRLGQEIELQVTKIDKDHKRLSLGLKQLEPNPWKEIANEFPVGKIMKGKVSNIEDYGAFIELKDGLEGLVHTTEIAWFHHNQHPKKFLNMGQEVEFVVTEVDPEKPRVSLSIKKCQESPWAKFVSEHPIGSKFECKIKSINDLGILVTVGEDMDGIIDENDIAWDEYSLHTIIKQYNKGDLIEAIILNVDIEKEKISLGLKQLTDNPFKELQSKYKEGEIVNITLKAFNDNGIFVHLDNKIYVFIPKEELAIDRQDQKVTKFKLDEVCAAKITNLKDNFISLSIKQAEMSERDRIMKQYGSSDNTSSIGNIVNKK